MNKMAEILRATIPVFTFLINDKVQVYLQRRFSTGYLDGYYESPAGKMDMCEEGKDEFPNDAACREVLEETGVVENLSQSSVCQNDVIDII